MTALPLATQPKPSGQPAAGFWRELDELGRRHGELWRQASDATPRVGPRVGRLRQRGNARATRRLIDELARRVETSPDEPAAQAAWRDEVKESVRRFGEERFGWPHGYRRLLFADAFFDVSKEFVRRARGFDPEVEPDDLMQALRNVWILNSLQMLLDLEVEMTPAVFAYSMLYPYTDNLLDDPAVPAAEKRRRNARLRRRLRGEPLAAAGRRERLVFALVGEIERQYPRRAQPRVHLALQAIHRGQEGSLAQQASTSVPSAERLLALSIAKGGASVLADGYLAAGELSADEAEFCFGYGVFLQLLDDLQDCRDDRAAGHATIFSTAEPPLDRPTSRLWRFTRRIVDGAPRFADPRYDDRRDLIRRNCAMLLVGAVAEGPELFSPGFLAALERRWPLRFAAMRRLRRHADRRYRRTARRLRRRRGVSSLFELLA